MRVQPDRWCMQGRWIVGRPKTAHVQRSRALARPLILVSVKPRARSNLPDAPTEVSDWRSPERFPSRRRGARQRQAMITESRAERRAAALEAIGKALMTLAALEREADEPRPEDVLIDRRNCREELGLPQRAFLFAAGQEFPAFRVSRRVTATKADVLAWLKTRAVQPKQAPSIAVEASSSPPDPDAFFREVDACFMARVGRRMTDDELDYADVVVGAEEIIGRHLRKTYDDTPDQVAEQVAAKIGQERLRCSNWRSLGLDPSDMERRAEELRQKLFAEHPEMGWRERNSAVWEMWGAITEPLEDARRAARAAAREARKAEKVRRGELGLGRSKKKQRKGRGQK